MLLIFSTVLVTFDKDKVPLNASGRRAVSAPPLTATMICPGMRPSPPPPSIPKLDVGRIRDLLVKANEMAGTIRARLSGDGASEEVKELARFNMTLLDLVSAVVEEGILPLSSPPVASFAAVAGSAPAAPTIPSRPRVEPGTAVLKAALAAAEKSAIVFYVDL